LVEQKTFNLLVDGSNPSRPTIAGIDQGRHRAAFFVSGMERPRKFLRAAEHGAPGAQ
jgi:hypothetical protein